MESPLRPVIEARDLTRRFADVLALDRVSLAIRAGEFFSLLGPSGCGKTTLLRLLAGLDFAEAGSLEIDGLDASTVPAHRRPVNTVFQSYALFPHLNVHANVAFGLRMKKVPPTEIERRVRDVMDLVQIGGLALRRPHQLSGGQKQRVALARAVVNEPRVLLLDEPLAALDLQLRKELQRELRSLQRRLGITFVYVTHDQEEALVLSDRIAVMREGRIEQLGTPRDLYERPRNRFVSRFLGSGSLIEVRVKASQDEAFLAEAPFGELWVRQPRPDRDRITLAIRPERVRLGARSLENPVKPGTNRFTGRIADRIYAGAETHYELSLGTTVLRAEAFNTTDHPTTLQPGAEVVVELPAEGLVVLDD